jgi:hypothetical protein
VSPIEAVKYQFRKPNFLILVESAASMQGIPGENPARFNEVGADCQNGDRFCRLTGQAGRCEFSGMGQYGYVFDYVPAGTNSALGTRTSGGTMTVSQTATGIQIVNPTVGKTATTTTPSGLTVTVSGAGTITAGATQTAYPTTTLVGNQTYNPTSTLTGARTYNPTSTLTGAQTYYPTSTLTASRTYYTTSTLTGSVAQTTTVVAYSTAHTTGDAIGVDTGIVGYWGLDNTFADDSGNQNDGTGVGVATATALAFGTGAAQFQTTTSTTATKYVDLPASMGFPTGTSTALTVAVWLRPTVVNARQSVISYDGNTTDGNGGGFRLLIGASGNNICMDNNSDTGQICDTAPNQNAWTLVVVTVSGTSWTMYRYGKDPTCSGPTIKTGSIAATTFAAGGAWHLGASGTNHKYGFDGILDEVRIWSRALTDTSQFGNICSCGALSCSPVPTGTVTTIKTVTALPTKTVSSTNTASVSQSTTNTGTVTPTASLSMTTTNTGTVTPTASVSRTTTNTGTVTPTISRSQTTTNLGTVTPTVNRTMTTTNTGTLSSTASVTASFSATGTVSSTTTTPLIGSYTDVGTNTVTLVGMQSVTASATTTLVVKPLPDTGGCSDASCGGAQPARCFLDSGRTCTNDVDCSISGDICQNFKTNDPGRVRGDVCVTPTPIGHTCRYQAKSCSTSADCGTGDYCVEGTPARMCQNTGLWCADSSWCGSGDACIPATSRLTMVKNAVRRVMLEHAYDHTAVVKMGHMHSFQADRSGNTANLFPYVKLDTSFATSTRTELKFLPRSELVKGIDGNGNPCFSQAGGPSSSCTIDYGGAGAVSTPPVQYSLQNGNNSRYAVPSGDGKTYLRTDMPWDSSCKTLCPLASGTGQYEGSYYTFGYQWGVPVASGDGSVAQPRYTTTYQGKSFGSVGDTWVLMDAERSEFVNENKYGANQFSGAAWSPGFTPAGPEYPLPLVGVNTNDFTVAGTCTASNGAQWDSNVVPMVNDTVFPEPPAAGKSVTPEAKALMNAARLEKASYGGFYATGNTEPIACALNDDGANDKYHSVDGYMSVVKGSDKTANGGASPCWENHVLMIVDGLPRGPGDTALGTVDCSVDACMYDPGTNADLKGCNCPAVTKAWTLAKTAGVDVHVIAASPDMTARNLYAAKTLNNIARAGSTSASFINIPRYAANEDELYYWINYEMKEPLRVTVATTPASAASGSQSMLGITVGDKLFQTTVELPEWRGNLVAFNIASSTATKTVVTTNTSGQTATATTTANTFSAGLAWDAATVNAFTIRPGSNPTADQQTMWMKRRVFFSDKDGEVHAILSGGAVDPTNMKALQALGMGATNDETTRILEWMLGKIDPNDPEHKPLNPAVMGSVINSMAIDVGPPGASTMPGGNHFWFTHALRTELVYVGSDDGMLHVFKAADGTEAFAFLPADMVGNVARLYAQGGQRYSPSEHIYGLSGSPKVKNLCVANCKVAPGLVCSDDPGGTYQSGCPDWRTILVMTEGQGGNHPFALDITDPAPVNDVPTLTSNSLLWHVGYKPKAGIDATLLGETDSVPAFGYHRSDKQDDYRVLLASSGYSSSADQSSTPKLINAVALTGAAVGPGVMTMSPASGSCPVQDFAVVADVAVARDNFHTENGLYADQSLLATFVADTWGTLRQFYGADQTNPTTPLALGCGHPLHYSPAVVQLNRNNSNDPDNSIYLAQVTNSISDPDTVAYSAGKFPASLLVVAKLSSISDKAPVPTLDQTFGSNGLIKLSADADSSANRLCGVTTLKMSDATDCGPDGSWLPNSARPTGSPVAVLHTDGGGFQIYTTWYSPPGNNWDNCRNSPTNGDSYVTVHEFLSNGTWAQVYGMKLAHEYVTGVQFLGTTLFITSGDGTAPRTPSELDNFGQTFVSVEKSMLNLIGDRFIRTAWTERIDAE